MSLKYEPASEPLQVEEAISFSAALRLSKVSDEEQANRVPQVLGFNSVNISFILVIVKDKLTDSCRN